MKLYVPGIEIKLSKPLEVKLILANMEDGTIGAVEPGTDANYYKNLLVFAEPENDSYCINKFMFDLKEGKFRISDYFAFDVNKVSIIEFQAKKVAEHV